MSTGKRRASVAAIALALGLVVMAVTASAPPDRTAGVHERQARRETQHSLELTERSSPGFPPTGPRDINFSTEGFSTESGGLSVFECLGTVSHASIDNNFARLMDEAKRLCPRAPLS